MHESIGGDLHMEINSLKKIGRELNHDVVFSVCEHVRNRPCYEMEDFLWKMLLKGNIHCTHFAKILSNDLLCLYF